MDSKVVKSDQCPNCNHPLHGEDYCPNCGQKNDTRRLTFWHFVSETLSHFLAFDGRFFVTLRKLATAPGQVPLDYIRGKRLTYMNPLRIYFLSSLLLLFITQVKREATEGNITEAEHNVEITDATRDSLISNELEDVPSIPLNIVIDSTYQSNGLGVLQDMMDYSSEHPNTPTTKALTELGLEDSFRNRFLYHQADKISNFEIDEFNKYLRAKTFWGLFFFLPVMALILKLLYIRRSFYYPEHLYFTFYSQSVLFILLSISIPWGYGSTVVLVAFLAFIVYMYFSMLKFYGQGTVKTLIKFLILNALAIPAFAGVLILYLLIAFFLF